MKILFYSPNPLLNLASPAGYATHMREMIHAFRAEGHEVKTLIMGGEQLVKITDNTSSNNSLLKHTLKKMIPSILWETLKDIRLLGFDKKAAAVLCSTIKEWKPDLIYERCTYLQLSGVVTAKTINIPHVYEINAPFVKERIGMSGKSLLNKRASQLEKMQVENTSLPVVVSSALRDYFAGEYGIAKDRFLIVPNAIQEDQPPFSQNVSIQQELTQRNIKTLFGFVGSIFPWHGIDLLTRAFGELAETYPGIGLMIVGDGETLPALKAEIQQWKCADRIWFVGNVAHKNVYSYIDAMDCTLMVKSNWYGSPVKIFEYGARNKPIIAPDTIPVRDVMEPGLDGLLIQPTVEAIKQAMEYFLQHPAEMGQMANHFHTKVKSKYQWRKNAQVVLAALSK